jgi:hypothetical protein
MALVLGRLDPPRQGSKHRIGDRGGSVLIGDAPLVGLPAAADLGLGGSQETLHQVLDRRASIKQPERLAHRRPAVPAREMVNEPLHLGGCDPRLLHRLPPAPRPVAKQTGHT